MAVAVNPAETKTRSPELRLLVAGLAGALYVLGSVAVVFYGVPELWGVGTTPWLQPQVGEFMDAGLRLLAEVAAAALLIVFGMRIAGSHPPHGIRGGIFIGISLIFTLFFCLRAVGMIVQRIPTEGFGVQMGEFLQLAINGALIYLCFRLLRPRTYSRWSIAVEDQGWFSSHAYKRNQGQRVRRLTMLGLLLLGGSGVYTLLQTHYLITAPTNWTVSIPFAAGAEVMLLPDIRFTIPLLLAGLSLWLSWRIVNFPTFADFLIATEAEMNKVSWTPRKRLFQDTIVVLSTVVILTVFLLLVDLFWGAILSSRYIGVLPSGNVTKTQTNEQARW